jgi:hypothetical protein
VADCLVCTDALTDEEIIRLVTVCNINGSVAWRIKIVTFTEPCLDCTQYLTASDLLRKSLWCDDNGVFYIQVTAYNPAPQ